MDLLNKVYNAYTIKVNNHELKKFEFKPRFNFLYNSFKLTEHKKYFKEYEKINRDINEIL